MDGKTCWYIVDGYRPPLQPDDSVHYEGHECIMILNCNNQDAHVLLDVYFEDRDPVENIEFLVPAKRIKAFRSDNQEALGGLELKLSEQYSLRIRSDIGIVVQYGRCDVAQSNLTYMALMGFGQ
ncbi:MAG: sensory rhodopsin transducer [Planctomycetia bacterium]|nr:sensory rhodopsin transducer [Planctomycetia bacterium]